MARYHPVYPSENDDGELSDQDAHHHLLLPTSNVSPSRGKPKSKRRARRLRLCCGRRLTIVFLSLWGAVVFLLCADYVIFSKEMQPNGSASQIGWQALSGLGESALVQGENASNTSDNSPDQIVDSATNGVQGAEFPLDIYAPLVPNPAPLTELAVENCSPLRLSHCFPTSTPEDEAKYGKWVLMPRPLNPDVARVMSYKGGALKRGLVSGPVSSLFGLLDSRYVFYRRSRRMDVPRIVDVKLVEPGHEALALVAEGWRRIDNDLRSKYMKLFENQDSLHLYYKTEEAQGGTASPSTAAARASQQEPLTEMEIVVSFILCPFFSAGNLALSDDALADLISPARP